MRFLIILIFLLPGVLHAQQMEWVRHSQQGVEQIVLKVNDKKNLLFTNTNFFSDQFPARIGFFEKKSALASLKMVQALAAPGAEKKFVAPRGSHASPHVAQIYFMNKEVPIGSQAYSEIEYILRTEINDKTWTFTEGQKVGFKNFQKMTVEEWKTAKKIVSKDRKPASLCKRVGPTVVCTLKSGLIYAPKKMNKDPFK